MSTVINIGSHNSSEMDNVMERLDKIEDMLSKTVSMLSKIMYNQATSNHNSYILSSLNKLNYMMETMIYSDILCQIADETSDNKSTETSDNKSTETSESSISDEIDEKVTEASNSK